MPKPSRAEREAAAADPGHIPGLVLAYIHPGEVSAYFLESMQLTQMADVAAEDLGQRPRRIRNVLQEWSSANVSTSRNTVTERFLDTRTPDGRTVGDWLLWVDADMQWEPEAVDLLMQTADPDARPIVGGLCFGMATGEQVPTIYQWGKDDAGELTTYRVGHYPRDQVIQVAATGAAFLLIHRRVLEAMREARFNEAFPFFQEMQLGHRQVGEDLAFCIRAGQLGFPVHVDTRAKIGHHKSRLLTEATYLEQTPPPLSDIYGLVVDPGPLAAAVVATSGLPPERVEITADAPEGVGALVERGCTRVALVGDGVVIAPDTLPHLARSLATFSVAMAGDGYEHCFMVNATHDGVRVTARGAPDASDDVTTHVPEAWCLRVAD